MGTKVRLTDQGKAGKTTMNRARLLVAIGAATALLVAGCTAPSTAPPATSPTPTPSASIDCSDENITVKEWDEHCEGVQPTEEPGKADETPMHGDPYIPMGEPLEFNEPYSDGTPATTWKVTLKKAQCGQKSLPETDSNPKWRGSDDIPQYIGAKAPKGKDFCVLYWDWMNAGKVPDTIKQAGDLMFGDEQFARDSEDEMRSWTFMETNLKVNYSAKVNPRKTTKSADIYTVDQGKVPDAVWFPLGTLVGNEQYLMATK